MKLLIVHYHFRPGGVRRVIELAMPALAKSFRPRLEAVILAGGEAPDEVWLAHCRAALAPIPLTCQIDPALGYVAERPHQPARLACRLRSFLDALLGEANPNNCIVWSHNPGLGRNLLLSRELIHTCSARNVKLLLHHHDWWFDNRWARWPEMQRAGARGLGEAARVVFACAPNVRHAAINQADAAILQRHLGQQAGWLPNPCSLADPPSRDRVRSARTWLGQQLGDNNPVWLMPCRVLRRKNIAEALLLTRWLRPGAWLVTTAAVSSEDESCYGRTLTQAAQRGGWRLRLGLLHRDEAIKPGVGELMAASEALLLTSVVEGFGLPYIEAASACRPLIARTLRNVAPDLAQFGFRFPQNYDDLLVHPQLFDWTAEAHRQAQLFKGWRNQMPEACRRLAGAPMVLTCRKTPMPVPFSRLTLSAQLEVLSAPLEQSWELCAPLNPFLRQWRQRAASRTLRVTAWPKSAKRWLGREAYAERFEQLLHATVTQHGKKPQAMQIQHQFFQAKLGAANLYPLLWSSQT